MPLRPAGSPSPRRAAFRPAAAALLLLLPFFPGQALLAPPAAAQRPHYQFGLPGAGLPGSAAEYGPGILTAEEAEACLRRWQELGAMQETLERDQARLDRLEAELAAPPPRAAPSRGRAAASFGRGGGQPAPTGPTISPEQAAAERQAKYEAANTERRRYIDAVERFRAGAEAFNAGCALRRYYEADMRAARARLGIAE